MTAERQQLGTAIGLAAVVNAALLLILVWAMAVTDGLTSGKHRNANLFNPAAVETMPDTVNLVLTATPEESGPDKVFINSPEDAESATPENSETKFISSQNMRAATELAASEEGMKGLMTQDGVDKPFLDLRNSDFRDGSQSSDQPPSPITPPPPDLSIPVADTPPAPGARPAPPEPTSSEEKAMDSPPEPENPVSPPIPAEDSPPAPTVSPEPGTAAFRDPSSQNLLPIPAPTTPPRPKAPPLTRIPDRVPEARYAAGTKKTKSLGSISNKAGKSSVDAVATAEGRFGKLLRTAIEKTWRRRMLGVSGMANPGLVEVEFEVDPKGRISNVRLANPGEANPVMQDVALSAVIDAKLPAPPAQLFEDLRDNLSGGRMRCSFSFLIY